LRAQPEVKQPLRIYLKHVRAGSGFSSKTDVSTQAAHFTNLYSEWTQKSHAIGKMAWLQAFNGLF